MTTAPAKNKDDHDDIDHEAVQLVAEMERATEGRTNGAVLNAVTHLTAHMIASAIVHANMDPPSTVQNVLQMIVDLVPKHIEALGKGERNPPRRMH